MHSYHRIAAAGILIVLLTSLTGCDTIVTVTDEQRIVGTWKGPWTLSLYSNGDARFSGLFSNNRGKWKILPGKRLEVRWDDAIIEPLQEWKYDINGDTLTLAGTDLKYELKRESN
jgi:hypothetical protein